MNWNAAPPGRHSSGKSEPDPLLWPLEKDHPWYQDLTDQSRDLLCLHDLEGRLLSVGTSPAHLLGYSVEELLRIPLRELVAPEFRSQFDQYLKTITR